MPPDWIHASEDKKRQMRSGIGFIWASILMAALFAVVNFKAGNTVAGWWQALLVPVLVALLPILRSTARVLIVGNICMFGGLSSIFWGCWYGGGLEAPAVYMLIVSAAWGYLGFGKGTAIAWTWVAVVMVFGLFASERMGWVPVPLGTPEKDQVKRVVEAALALGFIYLASRIFNDIKDYAVSMLERRTGELKLMHDRLENLFGSMSQGVLTFDSKRQVEAAVSSRAQHIFGREKLEGADVAGLLFDGVEETTGEREGFETFVELVFDSPIADWSKLVQYAPSHLQRPGPDGELQHLQLELRPVLDAAGKLERIMLLATDETERIRMETAAKAQDVAHRREVDELRRMVAGGAHLILQFLEVSKRRIQETEVSLLREVLTASDVALAFQHVHTVRGEARTFQLTELSDVCCAIEEKLSPLRARVAGETIVTAPANIKEDLKQASALLEEARKRLIEMSPVGEAVVDQVTVRKSHVAMLCDLIDRPEFGEEIRLAVAQLGARPFGECTQRLPGAVAEWSSALSKATDVIVDGRDEPVPAKLSEVLGGVLGHLARNAVAHGIELPGYRELHGKGARARLRLSCQRLKQGVCITVEDDGAGIDEARIRAVARETGLDADLPLGELLFAPGLSTAKDAGEIAGRGMGMGAVRQEVEAAGYRVEVMTKAGQGTRIKITPMAEQRINERTSWRVA